MKRFFLIPLFAVLLALVGCTCSVRGSASMPTSTPTNRPSASAMPAATPQATVSAAPVLTASPEATAAPVMPTEPIVSPSADTSAGTGNP